MSLFSLAGPPSLAPQVLSTQRRLANCPLSFSVLYVSLAHVMYLLSPNLRYAIYVRISNVTMHLICRFAGALGMNALVVPALTAKTNLLL